MTIDWTQKKTGVLESLESPRRICIAEAASRVVGVGGIKPSSTILALRQTVLRQTVAHFDGRNDMAAAANWTAGRAVIAAANMRNRRHRRPVVFEWTEE